MIAENPHGSSSSSHFPETSLNGIGGPQGRWRQRDRDLEESQQFGQVRLQALSGLRVEPLPFAYQTLSGLLGETDVFGMADAMEVLFEGFLIRPFDIVEDIAGFVGPAALEGDLAINQGKGSQEAFSSVYDDQF